MAENQLPQTSVFPHLLRRMRAPLLVLITSYAIAVLGLVLIPGEAPDGSAYRMDFLHAFYIVSYTATTTGFGEIPYDFTGAQRLWITSTLYLVVISWLYAIGVIIALIRDPAFHQAVLRNRFRHHVRRFTEPFYLICGYGDTGSRLTKEITAWGRRAVVLDNQDDRISESAMANFRSYVPAYRGDAALTTNLVAAGLTNPYCAGVLAVTNDDHSNLHIAITAKLLNPDLAVIARAEEAETRRNMDSFGTDYIVDPCDTFAGGLALAIERPNAHALYSWMSIKPEIRLTTDKRPPRGTWIICGYGRLGEALYARLRDVGLDLVIVAETGSADTQPPYPSVRGKGTEADTLREAGIEEAVALIAATDDDADNLSIVMTARALRPGLFLGARQNDGANHAIFRAAELDTIMASSSIVALRILRLLATPLLPVFLRAMWQHAEEPRAGELLERLRAMTAGDLPRVWTLEIARETSAALCDALEHGETVTLETILRHPGERERYLSAEPLMIERNGEHLVLPSSDTAIAAGDRILFAGTPEVPRRLAWTLNNESAFVYITTGERPPYGSVLRWLARRSPA